MLTFGDFHWGKDWKDIAWRRVGRVDVTTWGNENERNMLELYEDDKDLAATAFVPFPLNAVVVIKERPCAVFDN